MSAETEPDQIFVVDRDNLPLAVMSPEQVHLQGLRHRGVMLLLTDRHGRLVLHRLPADHPLHPGRWDVAGSGHVASFEASEEAAERHLPSAIRPVAESLLHLGTLPKGAGTGNELVEIYELSLSDQAAAILAGDLAFIFVDRDELEALVASYPDQLSPDLLRLWQTRLSPARV